MTELCSEGGEASCGCLRIKAFAIRHTILQINPSEAYISGHIDQEKLIFWFTSAVDHRLGRETRSCGPASTFTTNYQTATPSPLLYTTSLHPASMCVLNTGPCNQQILHILPPQVPRQTSKEVKDGVVSLCACAFYCMKQPRDTGGEQPRKFDFMTIPRRYLAGRAVVHFVCSFVGFVCTWLRADHTRHKDQIWKSQFFLWCCVEAEVEKVPKI